MSSHLLCECTKPGSGHVIRRNCSDGCCFESITICDACDKVRSPLLSWTQYDSEAKKILLDREDAGNVYLAFFGKDAYMRRFEKEVFRVVKAKFHSGE